VEDSRPNSVQTSLWIFVVITVIPLLVGVFDLSNPTPMGDAAAAYSYGIMFLVVIGVPYYGLLAFLALMTYRGRNWARWIHSALLVISIVVGIVGLTKGASQSTSTLRGVGSLLLHAAAAACVVLLFTRKANAWYSGDGDV
jgi:formate-dependent nitrite reductase membrane component NrfD